jgi:hypothetical protein
VKNKKNRKEKEYDKRFPRIVDALTDKSEWRSRYRGKGRRGRGPLLADGLPGVK